MVDTFKVDFIERRVLCSGASFKAGYSKHCSRASRRDLIKSHFIPEIRLLKRCKTANLSRVSSQTLGPDMRRDSDSPSYMIEYDFVYKIRLFKSCLRARYGQGRLYVGW